jgi:Protein of unknown function (DUF3179)
MKLIRGNMLIKTSITVIGIVVFCVVASVVLTDPLPSTLPSRAVRFLSETATQLFPPARPGERPPLVNVPSVTARDNSLEIGDAYFVVGVELNGESRAYPLNVLSRPDHHILNDTLGGQPIVVTWCGLCQSPLVYSRKVDGQTLTFFVSGELYLENMVMKDVETDSDWPQMLGEAMRGKLMGKTLEQVPSVWTDWKSWRADHPQTTLPKIAPTVDYYRHDPDPAIPTTEERYFSSMQWGLVRGDKSLTWPLAEVARRGVVNDSLAGLSIVVVFDRATATVSAFERRAGDIELTFHADAEGMVDDQTNSLWDRITGRAVRGALAGRRLIPVPGIISHHRAWRTLFPATAVRGGAAK